MEWSLFGRRADGRRPLGRSIAIGFIFFISVMCAWLGIVCHLGYRRVLYERTEAFISAVIRHVERQIDADGLSRQIAGVPSDGAAEALAGVVGRTARDFGVPSISVVVVRELPALSTGGGREPFVQVVVSAGDVRGPDGGGFGPRARAALVRAASREGVSFFEEAVGGRPVYTGASAIRGSDGRAVAVLAVDTDVSLISDFAGERTIETMLCVAVLGAMFALVFLRWIRRHVTLPLSLLEESVVEFAERSHRQRDLAALSYEPPEMDANNEVGSLAETMTRMTCDMRDYVEDIILAEQKAHRMSELANKDSLTGVLNKNAYDNEQRKIDCLIGIGSPLKFGIVMIDLNFLKKLNDTYGHERGNEAIMRLCEIASLTFGNSSLYRIGGDEFVVILRGEDYRNCVPLLGRLGDLLAEIAADESLQPWERVSAAVGFAEFDKSRDTCVLDVFRRADQLMYENKKRMKAVRK